MSLASTIDIFRKWNATPRERRRQLNAKDDGKIRDIRDYGENYFKKSNRIKV